MKPATLDDLAADDFDPIEASKPVDWDRVIAEGRLRDEQEAQSRLRDELRCLKAAGLNVVQGGTA